MKQLITASSLTFTKPNCGCGIVSSQQRKSFLSRMKQQSYKITKKTKTKKLRRKK